MKQVRTIELGIMVIVFTVVLSEIAFGNDADLIPPEILSQMNNDIRSEKRPTIHTLQQTEIFSLRENPTFESDFVTFDFDPGELSSVQNEILDNWIRSGAAKLYFKDGYLFTYRRFFPSVSIQRYWTEWSRHNDAINLNVKLLRHPVNTDCKDLQVRTTGNDRKLLSGMWYREAAYVVGNLPPEASIVLDLANKAAAGRFNHGNAQVYFSNTVVGADSRRWYLNWWHWALGFGVPGFAETNIQTARSVSEVDKTKYDTIELKNGDMISGQITNATFTIRTSYATLHFARNDIDKIQFEYPDTSLDTMILLIGDKLSGQIQDKQVHMTLISGVKIVLENSNIREINMKQSVQEN